MSLTCTANIEKEKAAILTQYARESANAILIRGKSWPPKARYDGTKRIKFQTSLTDEEAAELEAIRAVLCPQMTRYAFIRYLIREFCEVARSKVNSIERTVIGCEERENADYRRSDIRDRQTGGKNRGLQWFLRTNS